MSRHGRDALSLTEARRRIAALRCLDLTDKSVEQLKELLVPVINRLPTRLLEYPGGGHFWRGVRWDTRPTKVSELSYPPPERVTRYQRANRPNEPRFYCAIGGYAPFYELQAAIGHCIALSKWRSRTKIIANHVGYTPENFRRLETARELPSPWDGFNPTPMMRLVHDFLAEQFSRRVEGQNDHEYKMSVAIAELLTTGTPDLPIHALAYPALATKGNRDNVVMFPACVDNHLELVRAVYFRVTAHEARAPSYHAEELAIAESFHGGEIRWIDQPPRTITWAPVDGASSG